MDYSKSKKIWTAVGAVIIISGAFLLTCKNSETEQVICTQEAKLCSDGSSVSRVGPDCKFAECPAISLLNGKIEKAVTDYLLTQGYFSWKVSPDSQNLCVVENLSEKQSFPLYFWSYCMEYTVKGGHLEVLSGSSLPVKINYPNELSLVDFNRFSYEVPRDGSLYSEDIKKIFPTEVQQKIFRFSPGEIIKKAEAIAAGTALK